MRVATAATGAVRPGRRALREPRSNSSRLTEPLPSVSSRSKRAEARWLRRVSMPDWRSSALTEPSRLASIAVRRAMRPSTNSARLTRPSPSASPRAAARRRLLSQGARRRSERPGRRRRRRPGWSSSSVRLRRTAAHASARPPSWKMKRAERRTIRRAGGGRAFSNASRAALRTCVQPASQGSESPSRPPPRPGERGRSRAPASGSPLSSKAQARSWARACCRPPGLRQRRVVRQLIQGRDASAARPSPPPAAGGTGRRTRRRPGRRATSFRSQKPLAGRSRSIRSRMAAHVGGGVHAGARPAQGRLDRRRHLGPEGRIAGPDDARAGQGHELPGRRPRSA